MNELIQIFRDACSAFDPIDTGLSPKLKKIHGIRAVVFDVYGTMLLSGVGDISLADEQDRSSALKSTLSEYGYDMLEASGDLSERFYACIKNNQAFGREKGIAYPEVEIRQVWEAFINSLLSDQWIEGAVASADTVAKMSIHYEGQVNKAWPEPTLASTVWQLKAKNIELGIVSNGQFFTPILWDALMEDLLADSGFDPRLCIWSYELREAKPSKTPYRASAEALKKHYDISAEECLYVGNDMRNDIWPASECGFKTALYAGDKRSLRLREGDTDCESVQPDLVITRLEQITESILD